MKDSHPGQDNAETYDKIGGWLILFAFGLVLYPVQTLYLLITKLFPAVLSDHWTALTTPTNPGYHSLWAPLVIFELVGSSAFFLYSIVIIAWFFQRRRRVPVQVYIFLAANMFFVGTDYLIINLFLIPGNSLNLDTTINFVRTVIAGAAWIPYFMFSRRVRQTFTR
jgi:hypothetical protein